MPGPDVLVFGGTGFVGSALIHAADSQGLTVAATSHFHKPHHGFGAQWHRTELTHNGAAADLIATLKPRAVVNAAYVQSGPDLETVTAHVPGEMATACADSGSRFVHLSTDVVFDGKPTRPYVETDPVDPVHDYGRAKAAAEALVVAADPNAVVVRTSLLWGTGPIGPQGRLVADPAVEFFTDEIRCPLRVDRLASALLELAFATPVSGLIHVAGSDAVDRLTFAQLLAPLVGVPADSLRGRPSGDRPDRPSDCRLDSARARRLLATPLSGILADLRG